VHHICYGQTGYLDDYIYSQQILQVNVPSTCPNTPSQLRPSKSKVRWKILVFTQGSSDVKEKTTSGNKLGFTDLGLCILGQRSTHDEFKNLIFIQQNTIQKTCPCHDEDELATVTVKLNL